LATAAICCDFPVSPTIRGSNDCVLFQHFARVALRVDRDEERLYLGGVGTELLECSGDLDWRQQAT